MRCDFCGEEIESVPFQKDGMNFCSLECSDAMETGESLPMGEDVLDDPEEIEDEDYEDVDGDQIHPFEDDDLDDVTEEDERDY
jgi:hypothetical protein